MGKSEQEVVNQAIYGDPKGPKLATATSAKQGPRMMPSPTAAPAAPAAPAPQQIISKPVDAWWSSRTILASVLVMLAVLAVLRVVLAPMEKDLLPVLDPHRPAIRNSFEYRVSSWWGWSTESYPARVGAQGPEYLDEAGEWVEAPLDAYVLAEGDVVELD